jgi:hypothetical protein
MSRDGKTTDRLLQATRNALNTASFRANQYKQVVQKKIDLGAIHKKIEQLQSDLGQQIDALYQAEKKEFLADAAVAGLLEKLTGLKQAATLLEEEIELIRTEIPPEAPGETQDTSGKSSPETG